MFNFRKKKNKKICRPVDTSRCLYMNNCEEKIERKEEYLEICNLFSIEIKNAVKKRFNFDFEIETTFKNGCNLVSKIRIDGEVFKLAEIISEGPTNDTARSINRVFTQIRFRKLHIVSLLMRYYKDLAKQSGIKSISLGVGGYHIDGQNDKLDEILERKGYIADYNRENSPSDADLVKIYEKFGFKVCATYYDVIMMECEL